MRMSLVLVVRFRRARVARPPLRPARAGRGGAALNRRRPDRHLGRPARARLPLARRGHRGLSRPGASRRASASRPRSVRSARPRSSRSWLAAISRRRSDDRGSEVALVLVGMLALGVILASDVFESSAAIETLLFGSLFLIDGGDLALAGGSRRSRSGRPSSPGAIGWHRLRPRRGCFRTAPLLEPALLGLVALATAAAVTAVGALLVTALFVVPAATTRLWTRAWARGSSRRSPCARPRASQGSCSRSS